MKSLHTVFKHLFKSLNPNQYDRIREKLLSQSLSLYLKIFLIGIVMMALLFIPKVATISNSMEEDLDAFKEARISINFTTEKPVQLLSHPDIIVDSNASSRQDSFMTVGDTNMFYRNYLLWGEKNATTPNSVDLKENDKEISSLVNTLAILFLPGIIIGIGIAIILLSIILILLSSIIAYSVKTKKKELSFRDILVISIHSILFPILLTFILIPISQLLWIPLVLYVLLFVISVAIAKGEKLHSPSQDIDSSQQGSKKKQKKRNS